MKYYVQMCADVTHGVPHAFLKITISDPDLGTENIVEYGWMPGKSDEILGDMAPDGYVEKLPKGKTKVDIGTYNIEITEIQYQKFLEYVNYTDNEWHYFPAGTSYDIISGEIFAVNCVGWARNAFDAMGLPAPFAWSPYELSLFIAFINGFSDLADTIRDLLNIASTIPSPIILDLDGDGIETTSLAGNVYFDHAGDGFAEQTAWASSEDGLLVRDLNNNGAIDTGAELFGNNTVLATGQKAANGFLALADLDSNKDGKIDASDAAFSELQVWKDADGNGITSAGELHLLAEMGVSSISTAFTASGTVDANGNSHSQIGSYTTTDGTILAATDVWFKTDSLYSFATEILDVPEDILNLPEISGYGHVRGLQQAMVRDVDLKDLVVQFANTPNAIDRQMLATQVIYKWTGVENINPASRTNSYYGNVIGDARKLEALEEFIGEEWYGVWCWGIKDSNPHGPAAPTVLKAYDMLFEMVYAQLMLQTHLKPFVDSIVYVWDEATSSIRGDLSATAQRVSELITQDRSAGKEMLAEFVRCFSFDGAACDISEFQALLTPLGLDVTSIVNSALAINGANGNDTLAGTGAGDIMQGFAGNDILTGGAGDDWISGGTGNDRLDGGSGVDVFAFSRGDGQDMVVDEYQENTIIRLYGLAFDELAFRRSGADLIVGFATSATDSLCLSGYFANGEPTGQLVFETGDGQTSTYDASALAQISIVPTEDADVLDGSSLTDAINALGGDDLVFGRGGNDVLNGGSGDDNISGNDGDDQITGGLGNDFLYGGSGVDTLNGGDGDDKLFGDDGNDKLFGNAGNDALDGGAGGDTMTGGAGDDLYSLDTVADTVEENAGEGVDTVEASATFTLAANIENAILMGNANIDATGNSEANTLLGNSGANALSGLGGDDTLKGFDGDDTLDGGDGQDSLYGGLGADNLLGGFGNDKLYGEDGADSLIGNDGDDLLEGGDGNDQLFGGAGPDLLDGGLGADIMHGGAGDDAYLVNDAGDVVVEAVGDGIDHVNSSVSVTLSAYVENLLLVGNTDLNGTGNNLANILVGSDGRNQLSGMGGSDTLRGGLGDDILDGGLGDDVLDGGDGADTMMGGAGDDVFLVDRSEDVIVEAVGEGSDTVHASSNYVLSANVESLILEKTAGDARGEGNDFANSITGNEHDNTLLGHAGEDVLFGGEGNDQLSGGAGNDMLQGGEGCDTLDGGEGIDVMDGGVGDDTYVLDTLEDMVLESSDNDYDTIRIDLSYTLPAYLEGLELTGCANVDGTGNELDNHLTGNAGNNRLDGGIGTDYMVGGAGDDIYITDTEWDGIKELSGEGVDTELRGHDTLFHLAENVENLMLLGTVYRGNGNTLDNVITGNDTGNNLYGMDGNDTLIGGGGEDELFGGAGADVMIGGVGDDYYAIEDESDVIIEYANEGDEMVRATISWTLGENLERLAVDGTENLHATGNGLNNGLWGNVGDNVLTGAGGNDYQYAGAGNDTYVFALGDGQDSIDDYDLAGGGDALVFGAGIAARDVKAFQYGDSLYLRVGNGGDQVGFIDYFVQDVEEGGLRYDHKINEVRFADGTIWDQTTIQKLVDQVANNTAPEINAYPPAMQARVGELFTQTVAEDTITDPDPWDSITYSAAMPDGSALPSWLSCDSATRTFSGTPGADAVGQTQVVLWGTDTNGAAKGVYVAIAISPSNEAPFVAAPLADQPAAAGEVFQYVVPESSFADPAADTLTYSAAMPDGSALPSWLPFDPATRTFSGTPPEGVLSFEIRVTVSDPGGLTAFDDFGLQFGGESLTLIGTDGDDLLSGGAAADTLHGLGGNDTLLGGSGDDVLAAGDGNDRLEGGGGNDALSGGNGDDIYVYTSGNDTLEDSGGVDTLLFGGGITFSQVGSGLMMSGNDLVLRVSGSTENTVTLSSFFLGGTHLVETIGFETGGTISAEQIFEAFGLAMPETTPETYAQTLTGTSAADTLAGGAEGDLLQGLGGDDILSGMAGNDRLEGGADDDWLEGGAGGDMLLGGAGDDTYVFAPGFGQDVVDNVGGGADMIRFEDIAFSQVGSNLMKSGDDLILQVAATSDQVTVQDFFLGGEHAVSAIEFASGGSISAEQLFGVFGVAMPVG